MVKRRISNNDQKMISRWLPMLKKYNGLHYNRKAKMAKAVLHLRYRTLGHGRHRLVYDLGNFRVLKVAISIRGLLCNVMEQKLYVSSAKSIKKHLCPVVGSGNGWILMRKMKGKVSKTRKFHKQLGQLKKKLRKAGIQPADLSPGNLTWYRGRIVVLDYGHFQAPHLKLNKAPAKSVSKPATKPITKPVIRREKNSTRMPSTTDDQSSELAVREERDESSLTELISTPEVLPSALVCDPYCPITEAEADSEPPSKVIFPMKDYDSI